MTQSALEANANRVSSAAAFERDGVHRAGEVCVTTVRREHGSAHYDVADGAGERREPLQRPFPRHGAGGEVVRLPVDLDNGLEQRGISTSEEVRVCREFHRGAGSAM